MVGLEPEEVGVALGAGLDVARALGVVLGGCDEGGVAAELAHGGAALTFDLAAEALQVGGTRRIEAGDGGVVFGGRCVGQRWANRRRSIIVVKQEAVRVAPKAELGRGNLEVVLEFQGDERRRIIEVAQAKKKGSSYGGGDERSSR